ncbi:MAG TPA: hypothetical protein VEF72_02305 [Mycobacterium sp.]|nr:hypothetical protein [Mycobacterium sp.]
MTGPHSDTQDTPSPSTRPISVAELLAKNELIGAPPVTGRRRRRRGNTDAVTVAELTGEIPVISGEEHHDETTHPSPATHAQPANGGVRLAEPVPEEQPEPLQEEPKTAYWSEPEPRWPESPPQTQPEPGPPRSAYPRPLRPSAERSGAEPQSGAEGMSPDPLEDYADIPVDVMDTDVREAEPATEDSAYDVRSYLRASASRLFSGKVTAWEVARRRFGMAGEPDGAESLAADEELDDDHVDIEDDLAGDVEDSYARPARAEVLLRGGLVVLQSMLAVAFGAGLFIAFDQLWRWNNIVALVLSVLVILGLVVGVRVVRRTEDIASTLIAVAVGALVTLGPLALLQSG